MTPSDLEHTLVRLPLRDLNLRVGGSPRRLIEFVFTYTPDELAALDRRAASA